VFSFHIQYSAKCPLASTLPAPEQTDKVFAISLPVGNWIVFHSFVIDHEISFAYERPLCANSGRSGALTEYGHRGRGGIRREMAPPI